MTVVDPAEMEFSSMDQAKQGEPVSMVGVKLHILLHGARYNLHERKVTAVRAEAEE